MGQLISRLPMTSAVRGSPDLHTFGLTLMKREIEGERERGWGGVGGMRFSKSEPVDLAVRR